MSAEPRDVLLDCLSLSPASVVPAASPEQALWHLFTGDASGKTDLAGLPGARCRLRGESGRRIDSPLVCADPVNFRADRDFARVTPAAALAIEAADAGALIDSLNALVADDGLQFLHHSTSGWYLQGMTGEALACLPTAQVAYRNIDQYPPALEDGAQWRRLMSEVQMLMHSHEVNVSRAKRGLAAINGLWFWGGGAIEERQAGDDPPSFRLFADDAFAQGLAGFTGIPYEALAGAGEGLARLAAQATGSGGDTLVVMDTQVRDALLAADVDALERALDHLAAARLAPLQHCLDEGRVGSVTIDTGDSLAVSLANGKRSIWSRMFGRVLVR